MSNNIKLEGIELLYYLINKYNMSYEQAVKEMQEHKQDMKFLDNLKLANSVNKQVTNNN